MMLRDFLVRSFFGTDDPPGEIEIGLLSALAEIKTPGYKRFVAKRGDWRIHDGTASIVTRFGPFESGTSFDTAVLFIDNQRADILPFRDEMRLITGMIFEHEINEAIGG